MRQSVYFSRCVNSTMFFSPYCLSASLCLFVCRLVSPCGMILPVCPDSVRIIDHLVWVGMACTSVWPFSLSVRLSLNVSLCMSWLSPCDLILSVWLSSVLYLTLSKPVLYLTLSKPVLYLTLSKPVLHMTLSKPVLYLTLSKPVLHLTLSKPVLYLALSKPVPNIDLATLLLKTIFF